jgi:hypothetical protein
MWGRCRLSALICAAALGGFAGLGACIPPDLRHELFIITANGADYPVMLSQTPGGPGGRKIKASSGTHDSRSSFSNWTSRKMRWSRVSASVKLGAQVERADKWVQIDGAEFHAEDFVSYSLFGSAESTDRQLNIQGTAHR